MAGGGEAKGTPSLRWPTPSDLNTRLRRIIAGYQRVVKKAELKKAAAEKASSNEKKMTWKKSSDMNIGCWQGNLHNLSEKTTFFHCTGTRKERKI